MLFNQEQILKTRETSQEAKLAPYIAEKMQFTRLANAKILVVKKRQQQQQQSQSSNSNQQQRDLSATVTSNTSQLLMPTVPFITNYNQQPNNLTQLYQNHSKQRSLMDGYSNSLLTNSTVAMTEPSLAVHNSRTVTPLKIAQQATKFGSSTATTALIETPPLKLNTQGNYLIVNPQVMSQQPQQNHQMINVNVLAQQAQNLSNIQQQSDSLNKTMKVNANPNPNKQVGFNVTLGQNLIQNSSFGSENSLERIEENRKLNSKRQFQIKKSKSRSKDKGLKSPSDFTNCGKSVVSLFSTQSGKTNHSAPINNPDQTLGDSPSQFKSKFKLMGQKAQALNANKKPNNQKGKKKIRPSSSISPQHNNGKISQLKESLFSKTGTNFNFKEANKSEENSLERSSKKVIPLKQIKFPKKAETKQTSQSMLPKPPLHKKNLNEFNGEMGHTSAEALIKMADENLASIEMELNQSKKGFKFLKSQINSKERTKPSIVLSKPEKKKEIQANFNLSFNNSFNTSYNNNTASNNTTLQHESAQQPPHILAFSSTPTQEMTMTKEMNNQNAVEKDLKLQLQQSQSQLQVSQPQYQGFFTADAIYLEKQLTNRLKEASNNEGKKMQAFTQTFNEIIKRDKNFGSLLLKIKQAYDEYIRKSVQQQQQPSPIEKPTYEDLLHKVESMEIELKAQKLNNEEQQKQLNQMKVEMEEKKKAVENLSQENDRLSGNYESFKISNFHVNKSVSISETLKSLQLSNSSNRTGNPFLIPNNVLGINTKHGQLGTSQSHASRKQLIKDLNVLVQQNLELTNACQQLHDEVTYFKLREKKVMYLVFILQNRGYPVNQIFEQEVKSIPTLRFQEFLDSNPELEEQMHADIDDDTKNLFSFRSDDSYELLIQGPPLLRKRPDQVPPLNLQGLPEYETSSDEGDPEPNQQQVATNPQYYQESLKYIENFYSKYAAEMKNNNFSNQDSPGGGFDGFNGQENGTSIHQASYYDSLSRDEEGQDDIKEEIFNS